MVIKLLSTWPNRYSVREGRHEWQMPFKDSTLSGECTGISIINTIFPRWCFRTFTSGWGACWVASLGVGYMRTRVDRASWLSLLATIITHTQDFAWQSHADSGVAVTGPRAQGQVVRRWVGPLEKGTFLRALAGRHLHFNALLYTYQREHVKWLAWPECQQIQIEIHLIFN